MNKKFLGASALILSIAMAGGAQAADGDAAADSGELEGIIVTGTRQTTRTVAESLAPIDVLGEKDLEASGKQSVRDLLGDPVG